MCTKTYWAGFDFIAFSNIYKMESIASRFRQ